jgi:hypothetical protein
MERSTGEELKMNLRRRRRFTGWIVLGFATAALAAPVAQADDWFRASAADDGSAQVTRPDDRAGVRGVGAENFLAHGMRPDDRAGVRGVGAESYLLHGMRPDDRAGIRGIAPTVSSEPAAVRVTVDEFSWSDAGIGAVMGAVALGLLAGATILLLRRSRHGQLSST